MGNNGEEEGKRECDLERPAGDRDKPDLPEILEREFQTDGEEQEDDPDLCKIGDLFLPVNNTKTVGTDNNAGQDERDQRGHLEPVEDHADHEGNGEDDQDVGEQFKDDGNPPGAISASRN